MVTCNAISNEKVQGINYRNNTGDQHCCLTRPSHHRDITGLWNNPNKFSPPMPHYTSRWRIQGSGEVVSKALDGISFFMEQGEFTAIMGASGSGKSTLLNVIATIDRPSSGAVYLNERNVAEIKEQELAALRRDQLGFIFQEYKSMPVSYLSSISI